MQEEDVLTADALSRRRFMAQTAAGISAVWASMHWPAMVSAAEHAHRAARANEPTAFEFFTPEEAKEIDAITSRIIPSDDLPGAHEAGVVYFIDKALITFAKDNQKLYRDGLPELQARVSEMYPERKKFSEATPEQQDAVLMSLDEHHPSGRRAFRTSANAPNFFDTLRQHAISGFLIDPDSARGGNLNAAGWKVIGRESAHAFQPPFGFYDKDYPGWEVASKDAGKR